MEDTLTVANSRDCGAVVEFACDGNGAVVEFACDGNDKDDDGDAYVAKRMTMAQEIATSTWHNYDRTYNNIIELLQMNASAAMSARVTDHVCGALYNLLQGICTSPAGILNHIVDFKPEGAKDIRHGTSQVACANQLQNLNMDGRNYQNVSNVGGDRCVVVPLQTLRLFWETPIARESGSR